MSMSQEEIEALMNESADIEPIAEDIPAAEETNEESANMSEDDIAALLAESDVPEAEEVSNNEEVIEKSVETEEDSVSEDNSSDIDDILNGIDGITNDKSTQDAETIMNAQIDQGIYPLPVEKEHKVVNQLNEVAEDSEEKATKIFDVLSFVLDENSEIQNEAKAMGEFVQKQTILLEAMVKKFPNITVLSENLEQAKALSQSNEKISSSVEAQNNQIFIAMDLMQFNDINRQKIERVMSVIKKLSNYLNGIFEDDSGKPDVQVAKHISGDSAETVDDDDINSLIEEFNN